ncbi:MAG: hypothetical protein JXR66_02905 [Bacteroidales bacterium]|nr:hypothetical protein [Bacteroidales bacterium]MBN2632478.1 hypothetical protein [Bacteroidales bacterium]
MVLRGIKRTIGGVVLFSMLTAFFSCEEFIIVDCEECVENEPVEVYLIMQLDINQTGVEVSIYEGFVEDSILFHRFTSYSEEAYYKAPMNKSYSLTAKYMINDMTYYVVDAITPRLVYEKEKCSEPCYFVYDRKVNLKLRKE